MAASRPLRRPVSRTLLWGVLLGLLAALAAASGRDEVYGFDDAPRTDLVVYPDWFNQSYLDLREDLAAANQAGKQLVLYFGQRRCAYCHELFKQDFARPDIAEYARRHFAFTAIDIWGTEEVTDFQGNVLTEQAFADRERGDFTPSLVFLDANGQEVFRLRGFYPPYQFRAALEYVADGHHARETFRDFLARGDNRMVFDAGDLNDEGFFTAPPHHLDRSRVPADRPLVVFFEQGDCHACDVLHGAALKDQGIIGRFGDYDVVQLDIWSDTPVVRPDGQRTTARQWAQDLGLFYTPSLLFFDERGKELLRVDSVIAFYRLRGALDWIAGRHYEHEPSYQRWSVMHQAVGEAR